VREIISSLISSIFTQLPAALFYKPAKLRTARLGEERILLEVSGQSESKEEEVRGCQSGGGFLY